MQQCLYVCMYVLMYTYINTATDHDYKVNGWKTLDCKSCINVHGIFQVDGPTGVSSCIWTLDTINAQTALTFQGEMVFRMSRDSKQHLSYTQ